MSDCSRSKRIRSNSESSKSSEDELVNEKEFLEKLNEMLNSLSEKNSCYYDNEKILEGVKSLLEEHNLGMMNRCLECGTDMGITNPRQLCGKTYCIFK